MHILRFLSKYFLCRRLLSKIPKNSLIFAFFTSKKECDKILESGFLIDKRYSYLSSFLVPLKKSAFSLSKLFTVSKEKGESALLVIIPKEKIKEELNAKIKLEVSEKELDFVIPILFRRKLPRAYILGFYEPRHDSWFWNPNYNPNFVPKVFQSILLEITKKLRSTF